MSEDSALGDRTNPHSPAPGRPDLDTAERTATILKRVAERPELLDLFFAALQEDAATSRRQLLPSTPGLATMAEALESAERLSCGDRVGPYRLEQKLGGGSQGVVYRAERADGEFSQTVAIKIARRAAGEAQLDWLRAERQTLLGLRHPNIVQFLDGATTRSGLPYFVVEYVDGEDIATYCHRRRLPLTRRLDLYRRVLGAVAAAHRASVIHCDLKPENILTDAEGNPRLCDFGISRLLGSTSADESRAIGFTLPYAPPEQIRAEPLSTATDVYALGVILYELVTGVRPVQAVGGRAQDWLRAIGGETVLPPSKRLRAGIWVESECRYDLRRGLLADLDAIALQALAPNRVDRYSDIPRLEDDLDRLLSERPVAARPAQRTVLLGKLCRRHRARVTAALLAAAIFLAYTVVLIVQRNAAQRAAAQAEALVGTLSGVLRLGDPDERLGSNITVDDLFLRTRSEAETSLATEPVALARLLTTLGQGLARLGNPAEAERLLRRAVKLLDRNGARPELRAVTAAQLGHVLSSQEKYAEAEELLQGALAVLRSEPARALEVGKILDQIGNLRRLQGRFDEARTAYDRALRWRSESLGPRHTEVAKTLGNLALLEKSAGKYQRAEELLRRAMEIDRAAHGERSVGFVKDVSNIAAVLIEEGAQGRAIPYLRQAASLESLLYGPTSPNLARTLTDLGVCLSDTGQPGAVEALERSIEMKKAVLRRNHPSLAFSLEALGNHYHLNDEFPRAEALLREALAVRQAQLPRSHRTILYNEINLASLLLDAGEPEKARTVLDAALPHLREAEVPPAFQAQALTLRGHAALRLGNLSDGATLYEDAIALTRAASADHPEDWNAVRVRAEALLGLGRCLSRQGRDASEAWGRAKAEATRLVAQEPKDRQAREMQKEAERLLKSGPAALRTRLSVANRSG